MNILINSFNKYMCGANSIQEAVFGAGDVIVIKGIKKLEMSKL